MSEQREESVRGVTPLTSVAPIADQPAGSVGRRPRIRIGPDLRDHLFDELEAYRRRREGEVRYGPARGRGGRASVDGQVDTDSSVEADEAGEVADVVEVDEVVEVEESTLAVLSVSAARGSVLVADLVGMERAKARLDASMITTMVDLVGVAGSWVDPAYVEHGDAPPADLDLAAAEIGPALRWTPATAIRRVHEAVTFTERLPMTLAALGRGEIDLARARVILEATCPLSDELARLVDRVIVRGAGDRTTGELRAAARRAVIEADPDGAEERRKAAVRSRSVRRWSENDGMTTIEARLSELDGALVYDVIDELARRSKLVGDIRTMDQRRADALVMIVTGHAPHHGVDPVPPPPNPRPTPARVRRASVGRGSAGRAPAAAAPASGAPDADRAPSPSPSPSPSPTPTPTPSQSDDARAGWPRDEDEPADLDERFPPEPEEPEEPASTPNPRADTPQMHRATDACPDDHDRSRGSPPEPPDDQEPADQEPDDGHPADQSATDQRTAGRGPVDAGPDDRRWERPGCACGVPACAATSPAAQALLLRAVTHLTTRRPPPLPSACVNTGADADGRPVEIGHVTGIGAVTVEHVRHLLTTGAVTLLDLTARVDTTPEQARTYRPTDALDREVREHDGSCRHPACRARATRGDLDHAIRFPDGLTIRANLAGLCRWSHRIKHATGWTYTHRPGTDGVLDWVSPTGQRYTTYPRGHDDTWTGTTGGP